MQLFRVTFMHTLSLCLLILCFFVGRAFPEGRNSQKSVTIIVNSGVKETNLKPAELRNIFLGKMTTWKNGKTISLAILKDERAQREFLRKYIKRNPGQFKIYWKMKLFTGKGMLPRFFSTDDQIIDFVSLNKGSIGFISEPYSDSYTKIVKITK